MYKILVVDDEELERKVLIFTLQNSGLPVEIVGEAASGRDAVLIAKETQPDVIFMDIRMPGIDGLEATKLIKQQNPSVEIIILTAYGKFAYSQQAIRVKATDYLLKPTHPQQIIEATRQALDRLDSKRLQSVPTLDLAAYEQYVRTGNHSEALASLKELLAQVMQQCSKPSQPTLNSLGFKLLAFGIQAMLDSGVNRTSLNIVESKYLGELSRVCSGLDLELWGKNMLESLFSLQPNIEKGHESQLIGLAMEYIGHNFTSELSLGQVAAHVHVTPAYLSRMFTHKTGSSFTEYITTVRITEAKRRLSTTHDTIDQIAADLGFCSNSYFSSVFKKLEGTTPTDYRIRHQVKNII